MAGTEMGSAAARSVWRSNKLPSILKIIK